MIVPPGKASAPVERFNLNSAACIALGPTKTQRESLLATTIVLIVHLAAEITKFAICFPASVAGTLVILILPPYTLPTFTPLSLMSAVNAAVLTETKDKVCCNVKKSNVGVADSLTFWFILPTYPHWVFEIVTEFIFFIWEASSDVKPSIWFISAAVAVIAVPPKFKEFPNNVPLALILEPVIFPWAFKPPSYINKLSPPPDTESSNNLTVSVWNLKSSVVTLLLNICPLALILPPRNAELPEAVILPSILALFAIIVPLELILFDAVTLPTKFKGPLVASIFISSEEAVIWFNPSISVLPAPVCNVESFPILKLPFESLCNILWALLVPPKWISSVTKRSSPTVKSSPIVRSPPKIWVPDALLALIPLSPINVLPSIWVVPLALMFPEAVIFLSMCDFPSMS